MSMFTQDPINAEIRQREHITFIPSNMERNFRWFIYNPNYNNMVQTFTHKSGTGISLAVAILFNAFPVLCHSQDIVPADAESGTAQYDMKYKIKGMSPQTASMIMYDKIPVLQNSGRLDLSIPVIHFQDPDFDFPISVRYNSEGFRPNEPDNFVGRDWSLECGGIIYREVKGKPDEMLADPVTAGFLWNIKYARRNPEKVKKDILSGSPLSYIGTTLVEDALAFKDNDYKGEFSSDIYHFNFGKHSGKFMIDFDGSVIVSGNDGGHYKVDISRYKLGPTGEYDSEIRITTDDGYTYCFGGSYGAVDYTALVWENVALPVMTKNRISGFYLSKIIAPNGRKLEITYMGEDIEQEYHDKPALLTIDGRYDELIRKGYNIYYSYSAVPATSTAVSNSILPISIGTYIIDVNYRPYPLITEDGIRQTLSKIALIRRISTDDKEISFSYSGRNEVQFKDRSVSRFGKSCGARLQSVSMRSLINGYTIERTTFTHDYQNNAYMFLRAISNSIEGKHTFEYNSISTQPCTKNIDYWGYSRHESAKPQGILPKVPEGIRNDAESANDIEYISDERSPMFNNFSASLLNRVTFPTGGYMTIKYEQNDYSSYFVKNTSTSFRKTLVDGKVNYPCGGARVYQLEFKDKDNNIQKRTVYKYTDYPDEFRSSGILAFMPQYYHIWRTRGLNVLSYFLQDSSDGFNMGEYENPIVRYSTVTEYTTDSEIIISGPKMPEGMGISPSSPDQQISLNISVGEPDYRFPGKDQAEKELSRWTFKIEASKDDKCSGYISIYKIGKGTVYEKKITGSKYNYNDYYETMNPVKKFGAGRYVIEIGKTGSTYVRFDPYNPNLTTTKVNGYATVTRYTDHHTNPDDYPEEKLIFQCRDLLEPTSVMPIPELDREYLRHNFLEPEDRSVERGKLREQILLNDAGDTVQTVYYVYARFGEDKIGIYAAERPVVANAITASLFVSINREHFYSYKPITCITTNYDIQSRTNYSRNEYWRYNSEGYMTKYSMLIDVKDLSETHYYYCHEMQDCDICNYGKIKEIINEVSGEEGRRRRNHIVYAYNDKGKISSVEEYGGNSEMIGYEHFSGFDRYGNPTCSETIDGLKTTYIWGYWGKYPVAVIDNASPEEVSAILGSELYMLSDNGEKMIEQIDALRELLPEAMVTTYTWIPLVGMAKVTDPSGTSTSFSYDNSNRLLSETFRRDGGRRELIKSYKYNILNGISL